MHIKFLENMNIKAYRYALLATIFIFINTGFAQVSEFKYRQITSQDGLVDDMALRVRQDAQGYMWFGTRSGLVRYDGIELRTYDFNPNQPNGLGGNDINGIHLDKNGNLWIGTINGLCRFDVKLDRPVSVPIMIGQHTWTPRILDITSDKNGILWISTSTDGLFSYNPETNNFVHFDHDPANPTSLPSSNVNVVLCTNDNDIWIGTDRGLSRLDQTLGSFEQFDINNNSSFALSDSIVVALAEGDDGDIWIGTVRGGLNRLNLKNKSLKVYKHNPDDPNSLRSDLITSILYDNDTVWLGSGRGVEALQRLDTRSGKLTQYKISEKKIEPRIIGAINDLYKDKTGIIWVCQSYGGVNYFDPNWENFQHYMLNPQDPKDYINAVYGATPISNTELWLSSFYGFILFDRNKGILKKFNDNGNSLFLRNNPIKVGNQIWAPSDHGIFRLDLKTGKVHYLSQEQNGLSGSYVNELFLDKQGLVWAGSRNGGLDRIDPNNNEIKRFNHIEGDTTSLPENNVFSIFKEDDQHFWIGTNGGLALFDKRIGKFKTYLYNPEDSLSLSSDQISDMCRSQAGVLWVASYGGGINRFNRETGTFIRYTSQNKNIPNNTVYSCIEDNDGKIWISTALGIARFSPENETCDFVISEPDYYKVAMFPNGELCYSGPHGIIVINPEKIEFNSYPPEISIEHIKIDGKMYRSDLSADMLELEHDQNDIEIKFFAAHFSKSDENKYAVFLKGYDDDWRNLNKTRIINYTNLSPGNYTLSAKAASAYDVWSEPINFEIHIKYPWWETWWAYTFYILFSIGLLYSVRKFELNRRQEKEKKHLLEAENKRKSEELERARQLQLSMLPKNVPELPNLKIAAYMNPATEVGGDYYDFHLASDGSLTVAVGDATGHGLNAGMMVTATKSLFESLSGELNPGDFMNKANQTIKQMQLKTLKMAFTIFRFQDYHLSVSGAGMPPLLIYRQSAKTLDEISLEGMPLGSLADFPYQERQIELSAGDKIIVMSDGFPERKNTLGEMLDYPRAYEAISQAINGSPQELVEHLIKESEIWADNRPQEDDMTFVVIEIK